METLTKLMKAKVQMIQKHPFYATVMLYLEFILDETVPTACTNGIDVRFNSKFVDELTDVQLRGLIAHEVMHVVNLHHARIGERDPELWNQACDHAINPMLLLDGFELPAGGLNDAQYTNMSAEEIYIKLQSKPQPKPQPKSGGGSGQIGKQQGQGQPQQGNDPGQWGQVKAMPVKASRISEESRVKQIVAQAANVAKAKSRGTLPAHIARMIDEMLQPVIDWKTELAAFMTEAASTDYSFARPSSRYVSSGLYLPSLINEKQKGDFVLIVDTSGSIDRHLLNKFGAEMQAIASECAKSITVIYVDARVNNVQEFEGDDELDLKPVGGGGTDFVPGFRYIDEQGTEPTCVIYFTDGCCDSFPVEPNYPVLWAQTGDWKFEAPFGTVLKIDNK